MIFDGAIYRENCLKRPFLKLSIIIFICSRAAVYGQSPDVDYNTLYRYPVSIGAEYLGLNPANDFGFDASLTEISGALRIPFPSLPQLQPVVTLGIIRFDSLDRTQPDKWDHTHYMGMLGTAWINRLSKTFELGGEFSFGLTQAVFPNVDPAGVTRGALNIIGRLGGRLSLDPSYNMSIDVHPSITYMRYIGGASNFDLFNGFSLGVGISGHYRFGEDPDAPQAIIRSLKFETSQLPTVFAAMQRYYVDHPIGSVKITNTEKFSLLDVDVSFFQKGFMDNPTKSAQIKELRPGETIEVPLYASFNDAVFSKNGVTPLTGEVSVEYLWRNRPVTQVSSVSYNLQDKTALTWDDDRKVGAFITYEDSALRNYASAIKKYVKADEISGVSPPLQTAIEIYYGLTELGIIYQIDPTSPFTEAQDNPLIVDSISLPRDTLTRLTGDCDDLTVVYVSLLESLGIETAFITVPGHIYAAFNTGVASKDFRKLNIDKNMTLSVEGSLWIPVEITLIGVDTFLKAWRTGISEFAALDDQPEKRSIIKTKDAQAVFSPVGLKETDLGLQYGSKTVIVKNFKRDIGKIVDNVLDGYAASAEKSRRKRDYNRLGVMSAVFGRSDRAEEAFNTALSLDRNYLSPKINLGNLYYMDEDYESALKNFLGVERKISELGKKGSSLYAKVLLNIARTYYELENYDRVTLYYDQVKELAPDLLKTFSYLNTESNGNRGADAGGLGDALFVEDEE